MTTHRVLRLVRFSLRQQRAHVRRTVVSLSALLVGVATVVVLAAVYAGAERRVVERVRAMGTNLLSIQAAPARAVVGRMRQRSTVTTLRPDDAALIANESPLARRAAPAIIRPVVARWGGRNAPTTLLGTTPEGLEIQDIAAGAGRLFDELEERQLRRVAVIGSTVARNLFGDRDPVGQQILIGRVPIEIIGVIRRRGTDVGGVDLDNTLAVPLSSAMRRIVNVPFVDALLVQAASVADLPALEADVRAILTRRRTARSDQVEEFVVRNQAVLLRTERGATRALRDVAIAMTGLSLMVGAVGILAVMLLAVRERIPEIALRRAIGARLVDIRMQFLLEGAMLGVTGGTAGVILGLAIAGIAALVGPWALAIPWSAALVALVSTFVMGLLIGVVPAVRAARLDPAVGLRGHS